MPSEEVPKLLVEEQVAQLNLFGAVVSPLSAQTRKGKG
jgi:hypothetical protein